MTSWKSVWGYIVEISKPAIVALLVAIGIFFFNVRDRLIRIETKMENGEQNFQKMEGQISKEISRLEGQISKEISRLESQNGKDLARLEKAIEKLESRLARGRGGGSEYTSYDSKEYLEDEGQVESITKESVTLTWSDGEKKCKEIVPLAPGARLLLKDKPITLDDIKPGMAVRVLRKNGKGAQLLEVVTQPEPPRKQKE